MVGAAASCLTFTNETALTLYQHGLFMDRHAALIREAVLIPEVVEEREILAEEDAFGYNRRGQISRIGHKGSFIDTYL